MILLANTTLGMDTDCMYMWHDNDFLYNCNMTVTICTGHMTVTKQVTWPWETKCKHRRSKNRSTGTRHVTPFTEILSQAANTNTQYSLKLSWPLYSDIKIQWLIWVWSKHSTANVKVSIPIEQAMNVLTFNLKH